MARTPKIFTARQHSRPVRASAPIKFVNEEDKQDFSDEIQSVADVEGDEHEPDFVEEDKRDILNIINEHHKHQARKATTQSAAFQAQKQAMYASARKNYKEVLRSGTAYIENARVRIQEMKSQETSYDKCIKDFERLKTVQEASVSSLLSIYPPFFQELCPQRVEQIDAASYMLKTNPVRREQALKKFSRNARVRVEQARESEKAATDASSLIKHYRTLLYM